MTIEFIRQCCIQRSSTAKPFQSLDRAICVERLRHPYKAATVISVITEWQKNARPCLALPVRVSDNEDRLQHIPKPSEVEVRMSARQRVSSSLATRAVQPVWWLAPSPSPVSPWKNSWK